LFEVGSVAFDAPFADGGLRPTLLLSPGGGARLVGWFGIAMARTGYVVIAVDHPGDNGMDVNTTAAMLLAWDRAEDLRSALAAAENDPVIGPHLDKARVGVAGVSFGGHTAFVAAGARPGRKSPPSAPVRAKAMPRPNYGWRSPWRRGPFKCSIPQVS